ncbi:MAG: helix-turn-helix transcriptional regulator [Dehalococcoidia bacterium]
MDERSPDSASHTPDLTDSEQRLLDHIRAGLVDAEIAVRLGLSNAEVKERIERLAAKLRVDGRDALRTPLPAQESVAEPDATVPDSRPWRWALLPLAVTVGLAIAFIAGLWVASRGDNEPTLAAADAPTATTTSTPATASPAATSTPRFEVMDGREMEYAGQLFRAAIAGSTTREGLTIVHLAGDGWIDLSAGAIEWSLFANTSSLSGVWRNERIDLTFAPGHFTTRLLFPSALAADRNVAVYANSNAIRPVILLSAVSADRTHRYPVHVDIRGGLWIAANALPANTILDARTGQGLELSTRLDAGQLSLASPDGGWRNTQCERRPCAVFYNPGGEQILAPIAGSVVCPAIAELPEELELPVGSNRVLILRGALFELVFLRLSNGTQAQALECPSAANVGTADALHPPGSFAILARSLEGEWLDVTISLEGTLVVGTVSTRVECPCVGGT